MEKPGSGASEQRKFLKVDTVPEVPESPSPNALLPATGHYSPEGIIGGPKLIKDGGQVESMSQFDGLEGGRSLDEDEAKLQEGKQLDIGEHPGMKVSIASKRSSEAPAATRTSFQ